MTDLLKPTKIYDEIWQIEGPSNDLMYLVLGSQKAMLVDTGLGIGNLRQVVEALTPLPCIVINTHGHPDHAGGNGNFSEAWLNHRDMDIMKTMCTSEYRRNDIVKSSTFFGVNPQPFINTLTDYKDILLHDYDENTVFDLGGREFTAIATPGHTPGSICLYEATEKILFSGDTVVSTPAWLYMDYCSPLQIFQESLIRLHEKVKGLRTIFTGHLQTMAAPDLLDDEIHCVDKVIASPGIGEEVTTFAGKGLLWTHGKAQIIYNPKNIKNKRQ